MKWTVSESEAQVLYADSETRLSFVPADNYNGKIEDLITFKAWTGVANENQLMAKTLLIHMNILFKLIQIDRSRAHMTLRGSQSVRPADGNTVFVADYNKGLQIIDVSDTGNPSLTAHLETPGNAYAVTLSPDNNTAYISDYNSLQIIDVTNLSNPTLIGSLTP